MKKYIPKEIEPKWIKRWIKDQLYSVDLDKAVKPYYSLMMFPYPSAEGLHVGNMYPFSGTDIFARFKRMQGFDVFEPIGLDGFGIHSENFALKVNKHPLDLSKETEKHFYEQLMMIGNAYDWHRTVETYKPEYYRWTQWLFLQMFKKGLAYRKKAEVNWCPSCLTVLADEQVIAGECERCGSQVAKKELEQWFFKITAYADRMLDNLKWIDWSEKIKISQRNWIGKSVGALINFDGLKVFTTRPDTLFGATFIVVSPEHPLLKSFIKPENKSEVEEYVAAVRKKSELERKENKKKSGVFTGSYVKNPATKEDIPVWVADYVLMDYGTGVIMAVPAHDERDFEFANAHNLPIKKVVELQEKLPSVGEGIMVDSGEFTGLSSAEARDKISDYLETHHLGQREVRYHLRDWLISRQRYWGPPIPIIYCDKCGTVPVPEEDLPVELPYVKDFQPKGTGKSPLASVPEFYKVECPECGGEARRETDVSDNFLDSAWYFLRYPSTEFNDHPFDIERTKKWVPVDIYIGGPEHANLHLLYVRFVTMVLKDLGHLDFEEPFKKFVAHGLIIKDGKKMSKSKGNVINPDEYIKQYGADTLRTYLMFMGPITEGGDFRDSGMNGVYRFIERVWSLFDKAGDSSLGEEDLTVMHQTIKKVGDDIASIKLNTAIAAMMKWLNHLSRKERVSMEEYKTFILLLSPFAPFITEELWEMLGEKYSVHQQSWPKFDEKYLEDEEITIAIQVNGKLRDQIVISHDMVGNSEVIEKKVKELPKIQKFIEAGNGIKKTIYIPGKIVNIVTN